MDPGSIVALRVYPPIGIARVGNATGSDDYVIGPEVIGGPPTLPDGRPARYLADFRTHTGEIKRQAARFRVFAHLKDGSIAEVTIATAQIEWRIAVANLKAGWYEFNQAMDLPRGLSQDARRRNENLKVPGGRASFDIVPLPRQIAGANAPAVKFDDGIFCRTPIYLGEVRTDSDGHLLFLGGLGASAPFRKGLRPVTFANNVGWHDDVADGPVWATVTFPDGATIAAEPGYVVVTPPNFAPGLFGVMTLDDTVREVFQAQNWLQTPSSTSFTQDIWPIFERLTGLQWINHGLFVIHGLGSPLDARNPTTIDRLRDPSAANQHWRRSIFALFRDPSAEGPVEQSKLPQIYGDGVDTPNDALALLPVLPTQYAHLRRWAAGSFADDWPGAPPVPPMFADLTPQQQVMHLERAPLHDCLGGPFHPGIEITWVARIPLLWKRAYRLKVLDTDGPARQDYGDVLTPAVCIGPGGPFDGVAAGAITRFLGVPWQTDGASCNSGADYARSTFLSMPTFWGARVPDQVLAVENYQRMVALTENGRQGEASDRQIQKHFMLRVDWLRDIRGRDYYERIDNMVGEWAQLGMVLPVADAPAELPSNMRIEQGRDKGAAGSDPKVNLVAAIEGLARPVATAAAHQALLATTVHAPQAAAPVPPRRVYRQGEI